MESLQIFSTADQIRAYNSGTFPRPEETKGGRDAKPAIPR